MHPIDATRGRGARLPIILGGGTLSSCPALKDDVGKLRTDAGHSGVRGGGTRDQPRIHPAGVSMGPALTQNTENLSAWSHDAGADYLIAG